MGYTIEWLVPDRLYVMNIYGDIDLDEYLEGGEKAREFVTSGVAPVHCILDLRGVKKFPVNMKQLNPGNTVMDEENLGWIFIMTQNPLINFLGSVISQVTHKHFRTVKTPEEAMTFLRRLDATLPEIPAYPSLQPEL